MEKRVDIVSPTTTTGPCSPLDLGCVVSSIFSTVTSGSPQTTSPPSSPTELPTHSTSSSVEHPNPTPTPTPNSPNLKFSTSSVPPTSEFLNKITQTTSQSDILQTTQTTTNEKSIEAVNTSGGSTAVFLSLHSETISSTSLPGPTPTRSQPSVGSIVKLNSFWDNKRAVGGVFGTIGTTVLVVVVALILWTRRHRRKGAPSGSRTIHDTSVSPFVLVNETRRRGMLQAMFERILNKTSQGREQEEVLGRSPIMETEPPPYMEDGNLDVLNQFALAGTNTSGTRQQEIHVTTGKPATSLGIRTMG